VVPDGGAAVPEPVGGVGRWLGLRGAGEAIDGKPRLDCSARQWLRTYVERAAGETVPAHPLLSPVFADLRALPPLLVLVGAAEGLLDDARALAARAEGPGTGVEPRTATDPSELEVAP